MIVRFHPAAAETETDTRNLRHRWKRCPDTNRESRSRRFDCHLRSSPCWRFPVL